MAPAALRKGHSGDHVDMQEDREQKTEMGWWWKANQKGSGGNCPWAVRGRSLCSVERWAKMRLSSRSWPNREHCGKREAWGPRGKGNEKHKVWLQSGGCGGGGEGFNGGTPAKNQDQIPQGLRCQAKNFAKDGEPNCTDAVHLKSPFPHPFLLSGSYWCGKVAYPWSWD